MTIPAPILKAINAAEDPMRYAFELGRSWRELEARARVMGGARMEDRGEKVAKHQNNLCLNGEGLRGVQRDALALALRENGGSIARAAKRLQMSRSGVYDMAKRFGITAAVLLVCVVASAQPKLPFPVKTLVVPTPKTVTNSFRLGWNMPDDASVVGFDVYRTYNRTSAWTKAVSVGLTNQCVATCTNFPVWFRAHSRDAAGDISDPSNVLRLDGYALTNHITWLSSTNLLTWKSNYTVAIKADGEAEQFRLAIKQERFLRAASE